MTITANWRLVFRPDPEQRALSESGGLIWSLVTKIVVEEVVDYHGN